ncbi:MAG TPA: immunoglobulin-like domain-containing protein [Acidimicrobiia bacterium]|nr:immunoglobulin-like domain-containing protein [Acidimicrobiia bacterium]
MSRTTLPSSGWAFPGPDSARHPGWRNLPAGRVFLERLRKVGLALLAFLMVVLGLPLLDATAETPGLEVQLTADPQGALSGGDSISYTYSVFNGTGALLPDLSVEAALAPGLSPMSTETPIIVRAFGLSAVDDFTSSSFDGSTGSHGWTGSWIEQPETDGPDSGDVRVGNFDNIAVAQLSGNGSQLSRTVDLTGFPVAYLTYRIKRVDLPDGAAVTVAVSDPVTGTPVPVDQLTGSGNGLTDPDFETMTVDITEMVGPATEVIFRVDDVDVRHEGGLIVDSVAIDANPPAPVFGEVPALAGGLTLLPGDTLVGSFSARLDGTADVKAIETGLTVTGPDDVFGRATASNPTPHNDDSSTDPVASPTTSTTPVTGAAGPTMSAAEWQAALQNNSPDQPLTFEQNSGQADPNLDFVAMGRGYAVTLAGAEAVLTLGSGNSSNEVRMAFVGAAPDPSPVGFNATGPGKYAAVTYTDVYPGIDVTYSAAGRELRYDLTVQPNSNPNQIALTFSGANELRIQEDGSLLIDRRIGRDLHATAPHTYQIVNGRQITIESSYLQRSDGAIAFVVGDYDRTLPLIIDPTFKSVATGGGLIPSGTNINLPVPAGVVAGDLLIAQVAYSANSTGSITPPAGWNLIHLLKHPTSGIMQGLYWREATASEPAQYGFLLVSGATDAASGAIGAYSGVNMASPIDAFGGQVNGLTTSLVAPSITTTQPGTTLIAFFAVRDDGAITPPVGMNERWDIASGGGGSPFAETVAEAADEVLAVAGVTGTRTATAEASDGSVGHLVALAPAPAASSTYLDEFNSVSFGGSDGTLDWTPNPWSEVGEWDGAGLGFVRVSSLWPVVAGNALSMDLGAIRSVFRQADLSGATSATLTFSYEQNNTFGTDPVVVLEVSGNGGGSWSALQSYTVNIDINSPVSQSFDISAYAAADTQIRFRNTIASSGHDFYLDDVQIEATFAANNPPVAVDDADGTLADAAVVVDVLANDSDPDSDPLTVDSVTQGANGTVVNNGTNVTYTPNASWTGIDTFTYTVSDGNGGLDTATVTVTVSGPGLFVVNSTGDAGDAFAGNGVCDTGGINSQGATECTLRAAIEEANAFGAMDTIEFNIPVTESGYSAVPLAFTLTPNSPYPSISDPATLDATTQPGYTGDPIVQLDGTSAIGATAGLAIVTNDSTIKGFIVHSFADEGLEIDGLPGWGDNNTLSNNWVGIDASGTVRGNTDNGILVSESASGNMIGGTGPFDGNVVVGSPNRGILIRPNCVDNTVIGNSVYGNTGLGIDLGEDGVTLNDPGDGDSGGNDLLNFPVITSATEFGGTLTIGFDLDVPAGNYRIEFFTNTAADPSGYGEGETFVAFYDVSGHPGGSASYSASFAGSIGDILTATTTEGTSSPFGPTSEYSSAVTVTNTPPAFIPPLADQNDPEGVPLISVSAAATDAEGDTLTYSATGLPLGLSIDSGTGLITGLINHAAAASSPYTVEVSVTDGVNAPVTDTFTWTVTNVATSVPYVVAGTGGAGGGDDLLTAVDEADFNPVTNEVDIGIGTGTSSVEAIAAHPTTGVVYAVDGGQFGTLDPESGSFSPIGPGLGTAGGSLGEVLLNDVRGLAFHPLNGRLYGVHRRAFGDDVLFRIDVGTGLHIPNAFFFSDYSRVRSWGPLDDATSLAIDPADWQIYAVLTDGASSELVTVSSYFGFTNSAGVLSQPITGLSFDTSGQLWGVDGGALYQVDKMNAGLDAGRTLDNGSNYRSVAFGLDPALPPSVEGTVFDDIAGNALSGGESPGDPTNRGVGGVTIRFYQDLGTLGQPDAADPFYASTVTGPAGHYYFTGFPAGPYWIVIDSTTVSPDAGGTGWAEQTYGPAGSLVDAAFTQTGAAGPVFGGMRPTASDAAGLVGAEHVAYHSFVPGETVDQFDFGFSFNVVTNLEGGDGASPQGSLRQFIANANLGTGPNMMRFVPAVAANDGTGSWWRLAVTTALPAVSDSQTTIDGTAYSAADGTTVLNPNGAGPELEISGPGVAPAMHGLTLTSSDNGVRGVAIGGFGSGAGVLISGAAATGGTVAAAHIGTAATGAVGNPNGLGVWITGGASDNTIGGTSSPDTNTISGNTGAGVLIDGAGTTGNIVAGNIVGMDAGGASGLANGGAGISIDAAATGTLIGGTVAGAANVVAYNLGDGIDLTATAGSGNTIIGNIIFANTGLGIDLGSDGVTVNDAADGDSGPNDLLNFPVITSAIETLGVITVDFDLDAPAGNYRIEFYANPTGVDPTGYGEGESLSGTYAVVSHPGGSASYSTTIAGWAGYELTATATRDFGAGSFGSSSEFSAAVSAVVPDSTPPVIVLVGANPQTVEGGDVYVELGATASDNYDGDLTGSIVIDAGAVNTSVVGSYAVLYDVVDSSGNPASAIRTVNVVDTVPPIITLLGPDPVTIEAGSGYSDPGATAVDAADGDLTSSIVVDTSGVDSSSVGSYTVTYDVSDSSGNAAVTVVRGVNVVDTAPPAITLLGADPATVEVGGSYSDPGATAVDAVDGDLTSSISVDASGVDTTSIGSYSVSYTVSDSSGNSASATRSVLVADTTPPVIVLLGANPQQLYVGDTYTESGATASDSYDGDITGSITIDVSALDLTAGGSYVVVYSVVDSSGNPATALRVVDVAVPNRPPVAVDDGYSVNESGEIAVPAPGILGNDSDPDGDPFTVSLVTGTSFGDLVLNPDGSFTYVHDSLGGTDDVFVYQITDENGASDRASVRITIPVLNHPPVAADFTVRIPEDTTARVRVAADADPDGDPLTVEIVSAPEVGTVTVAGGTLSFAPRADWFGEVTIGYTLTDPFGSMDGGTVVVIVEAVNDAPVGGIDSILLSDYLPSGLDVLENDWDVDGDVLSLVGFSQPENGTVEIIDGRIHYTPDTGWVGQESFTYTVSDGNGGVTTVEVLVEVLSSALIAAIGLADTVGTDLLEIDLEPLSLARVALDTPRAIRLLTEAIFQSVSAMQLPMILLLLGALWFLVGGTPWATGLTTKRRHWAVVWVGAEEKLSVHSEPSADSNPAFKLLPNTRGLVSTGRTVKDAAGTTWLPIECDSGQGWVNRRNVTEDIDEIEFNSDRRPSRLVNRLARARRRRLGSALVGTRGMFVSLNGQAVNVATDRITEILTNDQDGEAPSLLDLFLESWKSQDHEISVDAPLERSHLIPAECKNYHYLNVRSPGSPGWMIFFEYRQGRARIAGLGAEA